MVLGVESIQIQIPVNISKEITGTKYGNTGEPGLLCTQLKFELDFLDENLLKFAIHGNNLDPKNF